MDYQTSSFSLSQKLSTGHSIYDGVFSSAPFTSSFSSRLDDYSEIFGGASSSSSIPVLEVPELNERRVENNRSSKLDYSNVFGAFSDSDFAAPYEELFAEPKKKTKLQKESRRQGERVSPKNAAKLSPEENNDLRNGEAYESIDGVKKFSMSYNRSNNRSKSFAGVHSVPAYTCLVDETSPLHGNGDKPVSMSSVGKERRMEVSGTDGDKLVSMSSVAKERRMEGNRVVKGMRDQAAGDGGKEGDGGGGVKAQDSSNWKSSIDELFNSNKTGQGAQPPSMPSILSQVSQGDKPVSKVVHDASGVDGVQRKMEGSRQMKATVDQATDASKQASGGVAKVQNISKWRSSGSIDKFFYSGELAQETRPSNMHSFSSMRSDGKGGFENPMASVSGVFKHGTFEGADNVSSPAYFDEEVDTNSVAAASVAALTKAIEEAQASIQMAKELMDKKKVGPQYRVNVSFDNGMKPKSRKGGRVIDKVSISRETKTLEPYDKVDVPFRVSTGPELATPVFENASLMSFDNIMKPKSRKGDSLADKASIPKESKTRELYDKVDVPVHVSAGPEKSTPISENASIMSDVMVTGVEVREKEIAGDASIFTNKMTQELQEEAHVSAGPEQIVALQGADKLSGVMETQEKVHVQEFKPTPSDHRHEETDDSEAAEQFYEFADTSEQDVSDAAEQFYEFADSSEPDVSEATEEFYEFADSNEHHDTVLEDQEVNNTREMFPSVDEDEQKERTDIEALKNPEQVGKTLEEVTAEEEVANIFNIAVEVSEWEEHENELASSQESSNQDGNEKLQEAPRDREETGKLTTNHLEETSEEKQNGDDNSFETQELQEAEPVQIKSVDQVQVENEKIDREACMLEENEREQTYAQSKEDTGRSLDEDNNEEIIETVNASFDKREQTNEQSKEDTGRSVDDDNNEEIIETVNASFDKEDFEQRLKDDSKSVGNEKLQDTRPIDRILEDDSKSEGDQKLQDTGSNGKIVEEATCQECENHQEESFGFVEAGRMQTMMDESTENEKVQVTQEDQKNRECNVEADDNLYEQDGSEDPNDKQGFTRHVDCNQDGGVKEVAETSILLEENEHLKWLAEENIMAEKEVSGTPIQLEEPGNQAQFVDEENDLAKKDVAAETLIQLEEPGHQVQFFEEENDLAKKEVATETSVQLEENEHQTELVEEEMVVEETGLADKEIFETDGLTPGVKLPERPKQMEDATVIHSFDRNGISTSENDMSFVQSQDDKHAREPNVDYNVGTQVEECEELEDINSDMMGAEVANQENNKNSSRSRKRWFGTNEVSETFIKLEEDGNQSESVEEEDIIEEKVICEIEGLASGVKLAEILKQMEDVIEIPSSDTDETTVYGQKQESELGREPEVACNLGKHVEESGDFDKNMMGPEVAAVNQEENRNTTRSSHRKRWFDNGNDTKVAQAPHIFGPQTTFSAEVEQETQASLPAKVGETKYTSQKEVEQEKEIQQESQTKGKPDSEKEVELEKEHLIQKAERRRERERQKEKRAVERVIREARERSFADVKERVAENRQKVMAEAQGRSGKTSVQANDTSSLAEKASKEAKQKWERAAVERVHAEARDRALEKALAEKAKRSVSDKYSGASPDGKQAKRSVSEKFSGASTSRSLDLEFKGSSASSMSRSPNSSNQSDPSPAGTNGDSAQRCKAISERNQRTAERAAKALAEKNNRDLLVQQEQAERNKLAEVLDAEVKRWSSGKERNLRALLSTLQYILGPDSGWQLVPLTDLVTAVAVKKAYRKAALCVHPDKLQQRGASIQQKYTCEKVFDLLKDAWNRFSADER